MMRSQAASNYSSKRNLKLFASHTVTKKGEPKSKTGASNMICLTNDDWTVASSIILFALEISRGLKLVFAFITHALFRARLTAFQVTFYGEIPKSN